MELFSFFSIGLLLLAGVWLLYLAATAKPDPPPTVMDFVHSELHDPYVPIPTMKENE